MAAKGEIHYPKDGKTIRNTTFVAFGRADKNLGLHGYLYDDTDARVQEGQLIYYVKSGVSPNRNFWMFWFTKIPTGTGYKLKVFDGDDAAGTPLGTATDLIIEGDRGLVISYPTAGDNQIPSEFGAYGTSNPGGGDVSGSVPNVVSTYNQMIGPPTWALQMSVTNPPAPPTTCTLNVSQAGGGTVSERGLQFQVVLDPPLLVSPPPSP